MQTTKLKNFSKGTDLNRCKKYWDKSVQLTTTSIIISHTHAPLQLLSSLQITICNDIDGENNYGVTLQSCNSVWVWLIIIHVYT